MNHQPSNSEFTPTTSLPAKILKLLAVMAIVFALILFVVRSGAMRGYEQGPPTIEPGAHSNEAQP